MLISSLLRFFMKNMEKEIIEQIISSNPEKNTDSHVNTREPLVDQTEENVPINNDVRKSFAYNVALTTYKGIISYFKTNSRVEENKAEFISSAGKQSTSVNIQSPKQLTGLDRSTPIEVDSFTELAELWNDSKIW